MYNPEKLTRRGNEHAIHACVTQFSRLFTIFFSLLFVFPPCKFSSPYAPVYTRIIYIYLKCSSHGPAAIFTPAAPPLFTYLLGLWRIFSRRIYKIFANKKAFLSTGRSETESTESFKHWCSSYKERFPLFHKFPV